MAPDSEKYGGIDLDYEDYENIDLDSNPTADQSYALFRNALLL